MKIISEADARAKEAKALPVTFLFFGLLKRGGKAYTKIIPNANAATFMPIMQERIM